MHYVCACVCSMTTLFSIGMGFAAVGVGYISEHV